ncbi:MAG: DUF4919 domain-containing protein [Muribaculaceae bacterium]|nr:DUF4919 domain-containing protein [Muribaculaceae bacterium]
MIRKLLFSIVMLAATSFVYAAHDTVEIDINLIKVGVATNPGRYNDLVNRFVSGDTTLTSNELATVYYGYAFTSDYDPTDHYTDLTNAYLAGDYDKTWQMATQALEYNPVSLDLTIKALVAANNINNAEARKMIPVLQNRYGMISRIILESGAGTENESPFIVICEDDISRIVRNVIGAETLLGNANIKGLEAIKMTLPDDERQHILYFDNNLQHNYEREHGK